MNDEQHWEIWYAKEKPWMPFIGESDLREAFLAGFQAGYDEGCKDGRMDERLLSRN